MPFQGRLGLLPHDAEILSDSLAVSRADGHLTFYNPGGPILRIAEGDPEQRRLAAVQLLNPAIGGDLKVGVIARVLEVHRSSLHVWSTAFAADGLEGLRNARKGPQGPHKLQGQALEKAQRALDRGAAQSEAARQAGVTEGTIRLALRQGRLHKPQPVEGVAEDLTRPKQRNEEDRASSGGMGVKRHAERRLAATGELVEAAPAFTAAESVAKAGVLVALPVVIAQGLYSVGQQVYGGLRNGFFGLNSVLSTLVFMALLRIKSIEQLPTHAPGEFGLVLGLDRSPEMKTLRRKLTELQGRGKAIELQAAFADYWAAEDPELLGFLYVDGHVRPYNGRTHRLPKTHVPRRRLCMPATTDYWVNDASSDPLFFVTAPANEGLLTVLNETVLPEVREILGERRVTLVMDRECWSPVNFQMWSQNCFDVMTYRKGSYEPWAEDVFEAYESRSASRKALVYRLAEAPLTLSNGFGVREVRCLTESGHQTSIVTTRRDLPVLEIAERMFSRWRQENFFRYMRHEFDLDHLPTYAVEPADPERLVPNPARKEKKKEIATTRQQIHRLKRAYGELALEDFAESQARRRLIAPELAVLEEQLESRRREYAELPTHVPVGQVRDPQSLVRLEQERKTVVDQVKMTAYRAETELARLVGPLLGPHHEDEARSFLRQVFQLSADIIPEPESNTLRVRLHSMANWRSNRALAGLCSILNSYEACYPGTDLRLVLEASPSNA
jgi:hypothetical protein